jgi:hypothetical protein
LKLINCNQLIIFSIEVLYVPLYRRDNTTLVLYKMSYNKCEYITRKGELCGRSCQKNHTQNTRCSLHRGKISSAKCLGCDKWTRSIGQRCYDCNKPGVRDIELEPFLLSKKEIEWILDRREMAADLKACEAAEEHDRTDADNYEG